MAENIILNVDRKYRDTVFRILFGEDKKNAMSLYEAISGKKIRNPEDFEFTTLKDVIYMKMKNDVSFIVDSRLVLFEHQSTFNPNMPLRGLLYCAELYKTRFHNARLYSSKRIDLPAPEYIVFYNGKEKYFQEDRMELHLSDSFSDKSLSSKYEWTAVMVNINEGHNPEILKQCAALEGYTILIQKIAEFRKDLPIEEAVQKAMEYCITHGYLVEFLTAHMEEVFNMSLTEFDEKEYIDMVRKEEREDALEEGIELGQMVLSSLIDILFENGRIEDVHRVTKDTIYRDQLLKEYALI